MRWPVHPPIIPEESLSSWLRRIAYVYGLNVKELLKFGLDGSSLQKKLLDTNPPGQLLTEIAARTGASEEAISKTTIAGMLPFLFDGAGSVEGTPESKYFNRRLRFGIFKGMPWIRKNKKGLISACRECLNDYPDAPLLIPWQFAVLQSCPKHGLMLESGHLDLETVQWCKELPDEAPAVVRRFDSRTWAAIAQGKVTLGGDDLSAAEWFQLLGTFYKELRMPVFDQGKRIEWQEIVCDYCPKILFRRDTQASPSRRWSIVIAVAFEMIEKDDLRPMAPGIYLLSNEVLQRQFNGAKRPTRVIRELKRWTSR